MRNFILQRTKNILGFDIPVYDIFALTEDKRIAYIKTQLDYEFLGESIAKDLGERGQQFHFDIDVPPHTMLTQGICTS